MRRRRCGSGEKLQAKRTISDERLLVGQEPGARMESGGRDSKFAVEQLGHVPRIGRH
jgi:hypothetical protein